MSAGHPFRFGDVIELLHPVARDRQQGDLFRYALNRRRGREREIPASLGLVRRRSQLLDVPASQRRTLLADPGFAQELTSLGVNRQVLSGWLRERPDRVAWELLIPSMSYPELVDCLRHFDEAGISFETAMTVAARLSDRDEISASGLLPLRFAAARRAIAHQRWAQLLEDAAGHSMTRIPEVPGRTLLAIDHEAHDAVVFGLTLAGRCATADVVTLDGSPLDLVPGESPLHGLIRWRSADLPLRRRVDYRAVAEAFAGHDRIVIVDSYVSDLAELDVPTRTPLYAWQIEYSERTQDSGFDPQRMVLFGLTDDAFTLIPLIEAARLGHWPWQPRT